MRRFWFPVENSNYWGAWEDKEWVLIAWTTKLKASTFLDSYTVFYDYCWERVVKLEFIASENGSIVDDWLTLNCWF